MVLLKNDLPLFYFLLQSLVCQYLEDRPLLHRYYKVWPAVHKKEVLLLTAFTFLSQFCSFLFNSCLLYFFRLFVVLNHPHTQHLQDSELCQIKKTLSFFKEMVVLLCLLKTFKNLNKNISPVWRQTLQFHCSAGQNSLIVTDTIHCTEWNRITTVTMQGSRIKWTLRKTISQSILPVFLQ